MGCPCTRTIMDEVSSVSSQVRRTSSLLLEYPRDSGFSKCHSEPGTTSVCACAAGDCTTVRDAVSSKRLSEINLIGPPMNSGMKRAKFTALRRRLEFRLRRRSTHFRRGIFRCDSVPGDALGLRPKISCRRIASGRLDAAIQGRCSWRCQPQQLRHGAIRVRGP